MPERLNSNRKNSIPAPNEWDFVKDVSLEKTTRPRVVLNKDGNPETVSYTYIDNHPDPWNPAEESPSSPRPFSIDQLSKLSGLTDKNDLMALQVDHEQLRTLIAEKVGDENDLEKIDYYLRNPAGAVHDLVDAPKKFKERAEKGDLVPEQIISANEEKYDELLNRLAILEQNYPSLKTRGASANPDVPRDIDREWVLTKRYLNLLAEPVNNLNNQQATPKYKVTDSGEIIKAGHSSNIDTLTTALDSFTKKNKNTIDENISLPEKSNPHKEAVEWLSKINAVDDFDSLNALEKDFKDTLSPSNPQYGLRSKYLLNARVGDSIKEKRNELELKSATETRNALNEKYKDHINDLTSVNPLNAQVVYNQAKQNLETNTNDLKTAKNTLKNLQERLNQTPSYRKFGGTARSLKHQIEFQQEVIDNLSARLPKLKQQYTLANDRVQFYEANAKIAKLS